MRWAILLGGYVSLVGCAGILGFEDFMTGPAPVDAGEASVRPTGPGEEAKADFFVSEQGDDNNDGSIDRPLKTVVRAAARAAEALKTKRDAVPSFWTTGRVVGVVLGGIGITGLAGGSVLGLAADSKYEEAEQICGTETGSPHVCKFERSTKAQAARDDASSLASASTVLFVAGGVLAASGAALFVLSSPKRQQRLAVVPWPNGIGAIGSF